MALKGLFFEATMLVRQLTNEPPELQETQLSITVFIQGGHELLNHCWVISILTIRKKTVLGLNILFDNQWQSV